MKGHPNQGQSPIFSSIIILKPKRPHQYCATFKTSKDYQSMNIWFGFFLKASIVHREDFLAGPYYNRVKLSALPLAVQIDKFLHWQPVCQCRNLSICTAKLTEILWQCRNLSICTATINGINGFPHGSAETCLSALLKIGGGRMKGSRRGGGRGKDIEQIDLQG